MPRTWDLGRVKRGRKLSVLRVGGVGSIRGSGTCADDERSDLDLNDLELNSPSLLCRDRLRLLPRQKVWSSSSSNPSRLSLRSLLRGSKESRRRELVPLDLAGAVRRRGISRSRRSGEGLARSGSCDECLEDEDESLEVLRRFRDGLSRSIPASSEGGGW